MRTWWKLHEPDTLFVEAGGCRMVTKEEALRLAPPVYDRVRRERPGMMERSPAWWKHTVLRDAFYDRRGGTPFRRAERL